MTRNLGTTMAIVVDGIRAGNIAIVISTDTDISKETDLTTAIIVAIDTGIDMGDTVTMADTTTTVAKGITGVATLSVHW